MTKAVAILRQPYFFLANSEFVCEDRIWDFLLCCDILEGGRSMLQETLKAKLIHTDDRREMERIGEEIMHAMPSRYDARTMGLMKAAVAKSMPDLLGDEADRYLKRTVYGYWVYGVTTKEWFYYGFENKTDEEKCEYIGFMDRFSYLRHLNNLELGQKVLDDKYTAYQLLKRFYKREIIRIADEKDYEVFADFVSRHSVFVKKPLNANIGIGIRKITVRPDTDLKALFEELLKEGQLHAKSQPWGNSSDIILEELIRQDEHLTQLHAESVRITVFDPAVLAVDDILVHLADLCALHLDLIKLSADGLRHLLFLPAVELADEHYALCLRRKGPEYYAVIFNMRAQILVRVIYISHIKLLKVHMSPCFILLSLRCLPVPDRSPSCSKIYPEFPARCPLSHSHSHLWLKSAPELP